MKTRRFCLLLVCAASLFFAAPLFADKLVSLGDAMKQLDAEFIWDPFFSSGVISSHSHHASFSIANGGDALIIYDNKILLKAPSPFLNGGNLYFPEPFIETLKVTFTESIERDSSRLRIAAIIVDPGHGGKDGGASGNVTVNGKKITALEKAITLNVSKQLFEKLRTTYPDKQLIMTRTGDTYPTLEDRVAKAHSVPLKENEAIIYISVHANASFNKNARGYEVWYLSPDYRRDVIDKKNQAEPSAILSIYNDLLEEQFTTESVLLSRLISEEFDKTFGKTIPSRGIKAEEWYVVRKARMPSVLVELGFVTNNEDATLMLNHSQDFSDAIYKGITDFVRRFETSGGFTEVAAN
jgi:N-acetylmuramoyl-L-alanine amidase